VLDDILSNFGAEAEDAKPSRAQPRAKKRREVAEPRSALPQVSPLLLLILGAVFALLATVTFLFVGPAGPLSVLAWLLSLAALGVVVWAGTTVSWRTAGQIAAVSLAAALLVFTVRAGANAAYDEGNPDGLPPEMLIYAQGSPGLNVVVDNIEALAFQPGGLGYDQKIIIDNTGNIWPWPWILRNYRNLEYNNFDDEEFAPEPGSVLLIKNENQNKIESSLDQFQEPIPYTHMWWFPERYRDLELATFVGDVLKGEYFATWRNYFIDRELSNPVASPDMLAFFPSDSQPVVRPTPEEVAGRATPIPETSLTLIGGSGSGPGQFFQPAGLSLDVDGNLYVMDTLNHRVQRFARDGTFIDATGERGTGDGQFADPSEDSEFAPDGPWGIATDQDGNVYVADTWNHRIQKFGPDFEFLLAWGAGELFGPRDIAVDGDGAILVVDTGAKRIVKYTSDGELIESFGREGDGPGEFNEPTSISIRSNGEIYVADYWNQRIQHFDSDFKYIDEINVGTWGSQGITDRAYIVALDDGRVLATDPANGQILVFGEDGEEQIAWRLPAPVSRPVGIAVDSQRRAYVSDGFAGEVWRVPLLGLLP